MGSWGFCPYMQNFAYGDHHMRMASPNTHTGRDHQNTHMGSPITHNEFVGIWGVTHICIRIKGKSAYVESEVAASS